MARHENNGVTRENIAHKYKVLGPPHFFVNRSFLWSYLQTEMKFDMFQDSHVAVACS